VDWGVGSVEWVVEGGTKVEGVVEVGGVGV
jgi:hypothetical protein